MQGLFSIHHAISNHFNHIKGTCDILFQNGDVKQFAKLMEECNQLFIEAHKIHASLIQKEAAKEKVELSLLLIHAEDQLSSAELVRDTVNQMVALLKEVHDLKAEIQEIKKNID